MKHIRNTYFVGSAIAVVGLGLGVVTGGASLIATIIAVLSGIKSHNNYKSKLTANPSHFLWDVQQKAKK